MALVSFKHFLFETERVYYIASAWGFQRCSFRQSGQCEGLYGGNGQQNWLYAFLCLEKTHIGKLMLDEPVEHAKLIQVCLHNGITRGEIQSCFSSFCACLHSVRLGFLFAVGMSDVANGISIIILSEFYINEKYIMHTDTVFSGNFLRRCTCSAAWFVWQLLC